MIRLGASPQWLGGSVTSGQDVLYGLSLLLDYRELLGKVLDSVAEEAKMGGVKKADFIGEVQSEMAFLDHQSGHRLAEGPWRDFRCPEGKVSGCAQFLQQPQSRAAVVLHALERRHGRFRQVAAF